MTDTPRETRSIKIPDPVNRETLTVAQVKEQFPETREADQMLEAMTKSLADVQKRADLSTADQDALGTLKKLAEAIQGRKQVEQQMTNVKAQIEKYNRTQNLNKADQEVKAMLERAVQQYSANGITQQ